MAVLDLVARWAITPKVKVASENIKLGDGYNLLAPIGLGEIDETWDVASPALRQDRALQIKQALETLAGSQSFEWSPSGQPPLHEYRCKGWRIVPAGPGYFRVEATFERYEAVTSSIAHASPIAACGVN
jgi:phage-related protein